MRPVYRNKNVRFHEMFAHMHLNKLLLLLFMTNLLVVGEDRWLCTLLLQQGYRVEYCAASDALTYAPEGKICFVFKKNVPSFVQHKKFSYAPKCKARILLRFQEFKRRFVLHQNISCASECRVLLL